MGFRRQTMCLVALLSGCSVVNDFDFVEADVGPRDASADGSELDGARLDTGGLDTGGLDTGGLDVPPPPLRLTALSLEADGESVAFGEALHRK